MQRPMNRRALILALAALPAWPALAQSVDVSGIDRYLRSLRTAQGAFRQTNPNGSVQTGRLWLSRPGRVRFEYDAPKGAMVIADGTNVAVFDPKSTRVSSRYPLGRTPLALLLDADLTLSQPGLVRGAVRGAQGVEITVVDPRSPNEGRLVMTFSENPVALRGWTTATKAGQRTTVALTDLDAGVAVDRSLFNIEMAEVRAR
jgi:outer membrane lipoprotein-sorting protein